MPNIRVHSVDLFTGKAAKNGKVNRDERSRERVGECRVSSVRLSILIRLPAILASLNAERSSSLWVLCGWVRLYVYRSQYRRVWKVDGDQFAVIGSERFLSVRRHARMAGWCFFFLSIFTNAESSVQASARSSARMRPP